MSGIKFAILFSISLIYSKIFLNKFIYLDGNLIKISFVFNYDKNKISKKECKVF